ncbi:hypothetical protein ACIBCT_38910 [Streptosporangium sp. NPDC050855]|uniref:hypothetical protein n=1 Tax=Streptosporangium sp. NPDC050855 TaxID=3366194 RepID=UPI0037B7F286
MTASCPAWCQQTHDAPAVGHRLDLKPFDGPALDEAATPATIRVSLLQSEDGGILGEPLVRIRFTAAGRVRVWEMPPSDAADIGDLITALIGERRADFTATLIGLFWLAGGAA